MFISTSQMHITEQGYSTNPTLFSVVAEAFRFQASSPSYGLDFLLEAAAAACFIAAYQSEFTVLLCHTVVLIVFFSHCLTLQHE